MTNKQEEPKLLRLIDANLNRLKEGVRVIEDINRYLYNNQPICQRLKAIRHLASVSDYDRLLTYRDIENDVLKKSTPSEMERKSPKDLLLANYKRGQEAARVLEEAFKLIDPQKSEDFKTIRYELYALEKENLLALN